MTRQEAISEQERLFPTVAFTRTKEGNICHFQHRPTLPEICLDVRMAVNGAADPWRDDELLEVQKMLQARLETWDDTRQDRIDNDVWSMVFHTVDLIRRYLKTEEGK